MLRVILVILFLAARLAGYQDDSSERAAVSNSLHQVALASQSSDAKCSQCRRAKRQVAASRGPADVRPASHLSSVNQPDVESFAKPTTRSQLW